MAPFVDLLPAYGTCKPCVHHHALGVGCLIVPWCLPKWAIIVACGPPVVDIPVSLALSKSEFVLLILPVTVPPSAPLCQIQGSQDIGSDVILLCSSEEGIPRPTYLWEKLDNTLKLPPTATQGMYSAVKPVW